MDDTKKKINEIVGDYQYGFITPNTPVYDTGKGINETVVNAISKIKGEDEWMTNFRLRAYHQFMKLNNPDWGPDLSFINFDDFTYYIKPSERTVNTWDEVPKEIKKTFERLGIPEAERNYLAGVSSQFESEVVYHATKKEL